MIVLQFMMLQPFAHSTLTVFQGMWYVYICVCLQQINRQIDGYRYNTSILSSCLLCLKCIPCVSLLYKLHFPVLLLTGFLLGSDSGRFWWEIGIEDKLSKQWLFIAPLASSLFHGPDFHRGSFYYYFTPSCVAWLLDHRDNMLFLGFEKWHSYTY